MWQLNWTPVPSTVWYTYSPDLARQFAPPSVIHLNPGCADVLKKEWVFKGLVMSDWAGTYSCSELVNRGMDLEMVKTSGSLDFILSLTYDSDWSNQTWR
ncbi:uncharacterized protein BDZ99DRAFT_148076 [Mytilinidion resinicola]|uniref:Beta-glucosidase n=1 Tax=Mytilinidion resinicola TaxID=574789 RepID=A0A6A6Y7S9_9PEZI|nr:uncharacterized protein BDZ99DRAFT_148076 [Mytilinidion resinicola]KAF2804593.1 hypothetical protein BDZ99DRAFT_148076 [Mytilinidion resinicola]